MQKTPNVETQIYKQQQQQKNSKTNNAQTKHYETEIPTKMR